MFRSEESAAGQPGSITRTRYETVRDETAHVKSTPNYVDEAQSEISTRRCERCEGERGLAITINAGPEVVREVLRSILWVILIYLLEF